MSFPIKAVENLVSSSLRSIGYFKVEVKDESGDYIYIEADGSLRKIFVTVVVIEITNKHQLSEADISKIKVKASQKGREPWVATVEIDAQGHMSNKIRWKDLSKEVA